MMVRSASAAALLGAVVGAAVAPTATAAFQAGGAKRPRRPFAPSSFLPSSSSSSSSSSSPRADASKTKDDDQGSSSRFDPLGLASERCWGALPSPHDETAATAAAAGGASTSASASALSLALLAGGAPGAAFASSSSDSTDNAGPIVTTEEGGGLIMPADGFSFDPAETFQPAVASCPASDGIYSALQGATRTMVGGGGGGDTNDDAIMSEYAPILASGYGRIRSELCVAEGYFDGALGPFVKANGWGWVLPAHETAGTLLAGTVYAVATTFFLTVASRLLQIAVFYVDAIVGGPSRVLGGFFSDRAEDVMYASEDGGKSAVAAAAKKKNIGTTDKAGMEIAVKGANDAVSNAEAKLDVAKRALLEAGGDGMDRKQLESEIELRQNALDGARADLDKKQKNSDSEKTRMEIAVKGANDAVSNAEANLDVAKKALLAWEEGATSESPQSQNEVLETGGDDVMDVKQLRQSGVAQAQKALDAARAELDKKQKNFVSERTRMELAVKGANDAVSNAEAKLGVAKRALLEAGGDGMDAKQLEREIELRQNALDDARAELDKKLLEQQRALQKGGQGGGIASSVAPFFLVLGAGTKLLGGLTGNARKLVDALDNFVARYLAGIALGYIVLKYVHFQFFPDAFSDSFPDMSSLSLPQMSTFGMKDAVTLPALPDLDAIKDSSLQKVDSFKDSFLPKLLDKEAATLPDLDAIKDSFLKNVDSLKDALGGDTADLPSFQSQESKIESFLPKPPPVTSEAASAADAAATSTSPPNLESKIETFLTKPATPPPEPQPPVMVTPPEPQPPVAVTPPEPQPPVTVTPPEPAPATDAIAS